jgi:hypothetical protein
MLNVNMKSGLQDAEDLMEDEGDEISPEIVRNLPREGKGVQMR